MSRSVESKVKESSQPLTGLSVSGFKSIKENVFVEIRPITILAGANSSGKSSVIQPLLLLKQTLESGFDPGPLLISGSNLQFSSLDQIFSRHCESNAPMIFSLHQGNILISFTYKRNKRRIDLDEVTFHDPKNMKSPIVFNSNIFGKNRSFSKFIQK